MGQEQFIIGILGVVIGIIIYTKTHIILPSLIIIILGLALIFFRKEEDTIEKRRDKK
ncbi:MAG: hypothetical protein NUV97_03900 [archaeon]|nr:hypothetical protein [archaeon]MCR4323838.1 hypothetical protein [Nanoarchaeota archaeon]